MMFHRTSRRAFLLSSAALASAVAFLRRSFAQGTAKSAESYQTAQVPGARAPSSATSAGPSASPPLWDGASGVTWKYANLGYQIPWTNPGGDWLDANQVPQGATPYAIGRSSQLDPVSVDITALVRRWYSSGNTGLVIRPTGGDWSVYTRIAPNPAYRPTLTLYDGTNTQVAQCSCFANSNISTANVITGEVVSLDRTGAYGFLQFSLPVMKNVVRATLTIHLHQSYGSASFAVYELQHPKIFSGNGVAEQGLAANYLRDAGITADPAVIYATDFSPGWRSFFNRGTVAHDTYEFESDLGVKGMTSHYVAGQLGGPMDPSHHFSDSRTATPNVGPDDLYFRYYFKPHAGYLCASQAKKLPGLSGTYGDWKREAVRGGYAYDGSRGGQGGEKVTGRSYSSTRPSTALSGWSARHQAYTKPTDANPLWPRIMLFQYVYWAKQESQYGDAWQWGNNAIGWVGLEEDRWYCIEHRVKMNSLTGPADANGNQSANADGICQGWVDGVLALDRRDVIWRYHPDIHVDAVWLDHYEGGMLRVEAEHKFSMAALVVAKKYIGPMAKSKASSTSVKAGVVTIINRNTMDDVHPCPAEKTGGRCLWSGGVKDDGGFRYMFTQWCGGIYCPGIDSLVMWSGGESYNGPAMGFSFDTRRWSRVSDLPTVINGRDYNDDPTYNVQWGMFPDGVMAPPHSYDCLCYMPPEMGGGPKGSLITPTRNVIYGNGSSKWAVRCDLSTGHWHKAASNGSTLGGDCPSWVLDPVRRRYLGVPGGESAQDIDRICTLTFGDDSGIGVNASGPRFAGTMAPTTPCTVLGPDRLVLVGGGAADASLKLCAFDADALDRFYTLNVERSGFPAGRVPGGMCIGMGLTFCADTGEFWGLPAASSDYAGWGDPRQAAKAIEGLIRIIPPATGDKFTGTWKAIFVPITGATGYVAQGIWKRFMYHPSTRSVCWASSTTGPVYAYKVA